MAKKKDSGKIMSEDFEQLKKIFILKTMWHLKAIEELSIDDLTNTSIKAEIALRHSEQATSFMELSRFISSQRAGL